MIRGSDILLLILTNVTEAGDNVCEDLRLINECSDDSLDDGDGVVTMLRSHMMQWEVGRHWSGADHGAPVSSSQCCQLPASLHHCHPLLYKTLLWSYKHDQITKTIQSF